MIPEMRKGLQGADLSEIRNGLIRDFEHRIALKYDLILPKHAQKAA